MSDDRLSENAAIAPNTEITALAQQVATARDKLPLQHDTALYDALSDDEIRAERELAEWIRTQRRKQRRRAIVDELAADQRDRRTGTLIRRTDEADARWHRKALAARRRVSSADARLAQLYRRAEWSSRALIAVVVLGMVWAGVNVQHNLVPSGDMSDPLYWLSFGIEAMISIPIIVIMIAATTAARWGRELERGKVLLFELALLGTTVALNAGPHLASGSFGRAAEFAIAPVMVGVVIWLHAWVSARYAMLIESASVELPGDAEYAHAERIAATAFPQQATSLGDDRQALAHTVMNGVAPELRSPLSDLAAVVPTAPPAAEAQDTQFCAIPDQDSLAAETDRETIASSEQTITADREAVESPVPPAVPEPVVVDTPAPSAEPVVAEAETIAATAAERTYPHSLRRPSADKPNAPGTLELIHKAAADHRRNGAEHSTRTNGATPTLRRIPVTTVAHASAGDATGTDPVPEATMHAGTVARDPDGDTSAPTDQVAVHNDPQPSVAAPEQLTLTAEPAEQLILRPEPSQREPSAPAQTSEQVAPEPTEPAPVVPPEPVLVDTDTAEPVDVHLDDDEDLPAPDDFDFDEDTEVRALARRIAHRSPLRLTLDQIEEILELTDQSWSARSIGSEVGVPSSTVTNIVEFAHKIRQPYAFTG
ncbi:helix-turn-helix domain-containing protein [Nocardia sp. XZ_19_231]|uniref:helix-turn-helix domain-containing protein n=1 Tax=Nocardia sp. XZ_19_231 TaxID=2769252 RepID=UPI00188F0771|nr:helix-turn-helix domain-containing protein [Nocardia sp. XZ_19_231]